MADFSGFMGAILWFFDRLTRVVRKRSVWWSVDIALSRSTSPFVLLIEL